MRQLSFLKRPSRHELMERLKTDFHQDYTYHFSGLGTNQSIIVRKSACIAVRICYQGEKKVVLKGTSLSICVAAIVESLYNLIGNAKHAIPTTRTSWKMLEEELFTFINRTFHP